MLLPISRGISLRSLPFCEIFSHGGRCPLRWFSRCALAYFARNPHCFFRCFSHGGRCPLCEEFSHFLLRPGHRGAGDVRPLPGLHPLTHWRSGGVPAPRCLRAPTLVLPPVTRAALPAPARRRPCSLSRFALLSSCDERALGFGWGFAFGFFFWLAAVVLVGRLVRCGGWLGLVGWLPVGSVRWLVGFGWLVWLAFGGGLWVGFWSSGPAWWCARLGPFFSPVAARGRLLPSPLPACFLPRCGSLSALPGLAFSFGSGFCGAWGSPSPPASLPLFWRLAGFPGLPCFCFCAAAAAPLALTRAYCSQFVLVTCLTAL